MQPGEELLSTALKAMPLSAKRALIAKRRASSKRKAARVARFNHKRHVDGLEEEVSSLHARVS